MIELNLLPDVKVAYIKAKRLQRTVVGVSALVSAAAVLILVLFLVVTGVVQRNHLAHLNADIADNKKALQNVTDLSKILTVQNQLNKLPDLHSQKPAVSRLFGFMQQLTPSNVSVSTLTYKTDDQSLTIEGSAESLTAVNTYVDTLKFTNIKVTPEGDTQTTAKTGLAFKEVVLSSFAVSNSPQPGKKVTYSIQLKYDPDLFANNTVATLTIPEQITTRSETEKPAAIFQTQPSNQEVQR